MIINNKQVKGVIFDLDGTLIDSNTIWEEVDKEFFRKRNLELPSDYVEAIGHIGLDKAAIYTINRFNLKENKEDIIKEWTDAVKDKYAHSVNLKPSVLKFLDKLDEEKIPYCIATANSPSCYLPCLKHHQIEHRFKFILDISKFKKGKDAPDIYLEGAKLLNVSPTCCCVFEDLELALQTSKKASFITVGVNDYDTETKKLAKIKVSDIYITSYEELL